jgi:hypothetical protein
MLPNDTTPVEKREKTEYPPIPENIYQAEILDVNLRDAQGKYAKAGDKVYSFQFTLLKGKDKDGSDLRGRNLWANFVPNFLYVGKNGKNELYQISEAVLGHELTLQEEAELCPATINTFIGKQVRLAVKDKVSEKSGKVFSNIKTYYSYEDLMTGLNAEEKEKAKVKNTAGAEPTIEVCEPEIAIEDIPF